MTTGTSSKTAKLVGRSMMLAAYDPGLRLLLPAGSTELLAAMPALSAGCLGRWIRRPAIRRLCRVLERAALPGISAHYLTRKAWIERQTRKALASNLRRVIVLGAGFDTLASRLSREYPHAAFFELDHPATQREKAVSLRKRGNLRFVPVNLEHDCPSNALRRYVRDATPAMVIAEGLMMYLTEDRVAEVLRDAGSIAGSGGSVLFSFMEKRDDGGIGFRGQSPWVKRWLDFTGEPFCWGIHPGRLAPFLAASGLAPVITAGAAALRRNILQPHGLEGTPLAEGEWLCLARPIQS